MSDLENLKAAQAGAGSSGSGKVSQMVEKMRQEVRDSASALNLNPDAPDLDRALHELVSAGDELLAKMHPVDFAAAAHDWAAELQHNRAAHSGLDGRLLTASAAEAVRPDADLRRARDLEIASRAAANLEAQAPANGGKPKAADAAKEFADALAVLERAHEISPQTRPARETPQPDTSIQSARAKLASFAGIAVRHARNKAASRNLEAQRLALQASRGISGSKLSARCRARSDS